jgi:tRNA A-37 threonylcarbamoyl transferase component Bud32
MDLGPLGDRYQIVRPIGRGATATVLEAWDRLRSCRVAVKVPVTPFAVDEAFLDRLQREVWAVAGFTHPNVAAVLAMERAGQAAFVVVELVDGSNLGEMLGERGPMPPAGAARVAAEVCAAVAAAHARGIAHGHLVAANVLLTIDGRVKVTDFRLAQAALAVGEAAVGDLADPAGDVRALGRCLAAMLTGREPAPGEAVRLGRTVPAGLATIVARAAGDRDDAEAYRSAAEVGQGLAGFLGVARPGPGGASRRDPLPVPAPRAAAPVPTSEPSPPGGRPDPGPAATGPPGRPAATGSATTPPGRPAAGATTSPRRRRRLALLAGLAAAGLLAGGALGAAGRLSREPGRLAAGTAAAAPPTETLAATTSPPASSRAATTTAPRRTRPPATTAAPAAPSTTARRQSTAPDLRVVPNVVGLHREQAADVLARAQLGMQVIQIPVPESGKAQRVVAQAPSAGQVVPARSEVVVLVGSKRPGS